MAPDIVALMEGRLRRVTERTWVGELHGWQVSVSEEGGLWFVALIHPKGYTERVLRVDSLADGGMRARAWIEERLRRGD